MCIRKSLCLRMCTKDVVHSDISQSLMFSQATFYLPRFYFDSSARMFTTSSLQCDFSWEIFSVQQSAEKRERKIRVRNILVVFHYGNIEKHRHAPIVRILPKVFDRKYMQAKSSKILLDLDATITKSVNGFYLSFYETCSLVS